MKPKEFEEIVCEYFLTKGYKATTTPIQDYGVDVFAIKDNEKIAVQAKMYGDGRKINRQIVMELHGAKDYFECTKAVIATDGVFLPDAIEVAQKLGIQILYSIDLPSLSNKYLDSDFSFDTIWEKYILPLQGKILERDNGDINEILKVDWGQLKRKSSKGNISTIKIEIFKLAVNTLLQNGYITRDFINQNYPQRASSGVILILSQVPFFQITSNPIGLKYIQ